MNAPGSPSSALQMMYFVSPGRSAAPAHFRPVGYPPAAPPAELRRRHLLDHPRRIVAVQRPRQRLEPVEVYVLEEVLRVDDPAVAQRDAALAVEERHVAIHFEEALADGRVGHAEALDDPSAQDVRVEDLVQVRLVGDAVDDLGRQHQHVRRLADDLGPAQPEAVGGDDPRLRLGNLPRREPVQEELAEVLLQQPPAPRRAAEQQLVAHHRVRGRVQQAVRDGPAAQDVLREDAVDEFAIHLLVLGGRLSWDHHPDDGLAAAPARAGGPSQEDVVAP